jgi:hypothetical protein
VTFFVLECLEFSPTASFASPDLGGGFIERLDDALDEVARDEAENIVVKIMMRVTTCRRISKEVCRIPKS